VPCLSPKLWNEETQPTKQPSVSKKVFSCDLLAIRM
jgi:hypothetical protein